MSFSKAQKVEAEGNKILFPWLNRLPSVSGMCVFGEGVLHLEMQNIGDVVVQLGDKKNFRIIEIKVEESNKTGNFFLETWSNKVFPRNPGWLLKSRADMLFYYFLEQDELYTMRMNELQEWIFLCDDDCIPLIYRYKEKPQRKYDQRNMTYGACVPIVDVARNISSFKVRHPRLELESRGFEFGDLCMDFADTEVGTDEKIDLILERLELLERKIDAVNTSAMMASKKQTAKSLIKQIKNDACDLFGDQLH